MSNGMIEPDHPDLSISQLCKLLSIARSSFSYTPRGRSNKTSAWCGGSPPIRGANIDGWERRSQAHRQQNLHREAVADPDIRMRSLACLRDRIGDESGDPEMDDLLQSPTPSLSPRRQATGAGLLAAKWYQPTRSAGATSSL